MDPRTALLQSLHGTVSPPRCSAGYRLGLLVVAIAMLLLPTLYVALMGLVGYGLYYHAVNDVALLTRARGMAQVRLLLYFGPLIAGGILLLVMVKPLFVRKKEEATPRVVERDQEPLLFAFVEKLCRVVGAPFPDRIQVDSMINASAGLHMGLVDVRGGKLVLTIGLPLAAGLSLRQFAGVLAHEFGHFSQSAGMRLSQTIRRVNHWFARVVYERDEVDVAIEGWGGSESGWVLAVAHLSRLLVGLTRRLLQLLMMAGHAISCFLMRQMEFDADVYEARLVGGEAFASTVHRLRVLSAASQVAYADLSRSWRERRLADDLPRFVVGRAESLPQTVLSLIEKGIAEDRTGVFDTHPADRDRIARVREEKDPGLLVVESAATMLFRDFDALSRAVTLDHYEQVLGEGARERTLVETAALTAESAADARKQEAAARYYGGLLGPTWLLFPEKGRGDPARLVEARHRFAALLTQAREARGTLDRAEELRLNALRAERLQQASFRVDWASFQLPSGDAGGIVRARDRARSLEAEGRAGLEPAGAALRERLEAALSGVADAERARRVESLIAVLRALGEVHATASDLRDRLVGLSPLLAHLAGREHDAALAGLIQTELVPVRRILQNLRSAFESTPNPFMRVSQEASLGESLVGPLPALHDLDGLHAAAVRLVDGYFDLYFRIMAELAALAEEVETGAGLPPLG